MTISELAHLEIPTTTTVLERLKAVRSGIVAGKSNRQIALEIGRDEGTVRRDFKKLCLPAAELQKILSGADYEPIKKANIRRKEDEELHRCAAARARRRAEGLVNEEKLGTLSNALRTPSWVFSTVSTSTCRPSTISLWEWKRSAGSRVLSQKTRTSRITRSP